VSAGQFSGAHPGLAHVWAELEPGQVQGALRAIWAEVERMRRGTVEPGELERQKVRLEHDEASEAMSMEGMAGKLGYYECLGSDYRLADEDTARLRAVTAADVRRVMEKYFRPERVSLVVYRSDKAPATGLTKARAEALLAGASRAWEGSAPASQKGRPVAGGLTRFKLSSGGTLLVKPVRHTPVLAAQFSFPSGQLMEPAAQAGALNLLARTCLKGVPGAAAAELAKAMDDLGLGLGANADSDRFSVSLQCLSSKSAEALAMAGRCLREADLPEVEVAKERVRVLKDIKDKSDSPDDYVADLFSALHFGPNHPYGRPLEGDKGTVGRLKRAQLLDLKRKVLRPEGMVVSLVGDIEPARAFELFEAEFGLGVWKGEAVAGRKSPPALKPGPRRKEARLPKKQAHLIFGWPCPPCTHPDYPVLRLVNSVLGEGMDSRLFTEVRDKRGLCYSVYSTFDRRLNAGSWRVYVGTQPSSLKEAEAVCREVVANMARHGVTPSELASAKAYAKGIFRVARQDFGTDARVLNNYEFWGLGAEEVERVPAGLDAVTLADCARVAKQWLRPDRAVVAVVKP
jgi:predicted Zn-dependent peptidase